MNQENSKLKQKLDLAFSCIQNNNYTEAVTIYEEILLENKNNFDANSNLGMLYAQQNDFEEAEKYLNKAITINPNNPYAHNNLASVLIRLGRNEESINYSQKAVKINNNFSLAYNNLGLAQKNIKKNEDSKISFLKAIEKEKANVLPYYNLANLYEELNDIKNSEIYYLKAIEINAKFINSYNNLMNLYERTNNDSKLKLIIEKGEKEFPDQLFIKLFKGKLQFKSGLYNEAINNLESFKFGKNEYSKEISRCNTLANSYDEIKKYDEAFEYFELANQINFEINRHRVNKEKAIEVVENRINYFNEKNIKDWNSIDIENGEKNPIFIIGFPRSGTTLLDTILRSHPKIEVIEEKPIINNFIKTLDKKINSNFFNLKNLDKKSLEEMRISYFDILNNYTKQEKQKIIIDKMPLNIIYVGEIVRIFPDAKFILAIRHPCDCILSCFMQSFYLNDTMANFIDLESTSKFYNQVMILWKKYLNIFKVNYHLIRYEDLVNNFDINVKNLLNFLDLEWSDSVEKFYETAKERGKISTPSYNQVNKPIYIKSVGRWKNYEKKFKEIYPNIESWIKNFKY